MFGISAMHAYGHQWSCQLIYNPQLRDGFGLSDGEGVERLWSRLRKLIGIEWCSGVSLTFQPHFIFDEVTLFQRHHRLYILNRFVTFVGSFHPLRLQSALPELRIPFGPPHSDVSLGVTPDLSRVFDAFHGSIAEIEGFFVVTIGRVPGIFISL